MARKKIADLSQEEFNAMQRKLGIEPVEQSWGSATYGGADKETAKKKKDWPNEPTWADPTVLPVK